MSEQYEKGVKEFIKFAVDHAPDRTRITCPCLRCCFGKRISPRELEDHLVCNGIDKSYKRWTRHGESSVPLDDLGGTSYPSHDFNINDYEPDRLEEMTNVIEEDLRNCPKMFDNLTSDSKTPLYSGSKFTRLKTVLNLYKLKANNGWSDKSFTDLLGLLKSMLPEDNVLPNRTYEAKRMLTSIGMGYERIHACLNDCVLFRIDYASLKACPKCGASRYKKNESTPVKTMWYLPIIPRFKRMYSSKELAKDLTWHADRRLEERIEDDKIRHPSDSPQWKKIDDDFPEFGEESRNLRLVLATDGMNPHGLQSSSHSTWPGFGFLSPHSIAAHTEPPIQQVQYIARAMIQSAQQNKLFLAPYNTGGHWLLLAIDPFKEIVYYLDSVHGGEAQYRDDMILKFDQAVHIFRANKNNQSRKSKNSVCKWFTIKCPRQTNEVDCGYFVMRFMKEIISHGLSIIPTAYFKDCQPFYTDEQIDEVRCEVARYIFLAAP